MILLTRVIADAVAEGLKERHSKPEAAQPLADWEQALLDNAAQKAAYLAKEEAAVETPAVDAVAEVVETPAVEAVAEVVETPAVEAVAEAVETPAAEEVVESTETPAAEEVVESTETTKEAE